VASYSMSFDMRCLFKLPPVGVTLPKFWDLNPQVGCNFKPFANELLDHSHMLFNYKPICRKREDIVSVSLPWRGRLIVQENVLKISMV
jgi:hypothetical protein